MHAASNFDNAREFWDIVDVWPHWPPCTHASRSHSRCCRDRDHYAATATRSASAPPTTATPANASSRMDHAFSASHYKNRMYMLHMPMHSTPPTCHRTPPNRRARRARQFSTNTLSAAPVAARLLLRQGNNCDRHLTSLPWRMLCVRTIVCSHATPCMTVMMINTMHASDATLHAQPTLSVRSRMRTHTVHHAGTLLWRRGSNGSRWRRTTQLTCAFQ